MEDRRRQDSRSRRHSPPNYRSRNLGDFRKSSRRRRSRSRRDSHRGWLRGRLGYGLGRRGSPLRPDFHRANFRSGQWFEFNFWPRFAFGYPYNDLCDVRDLDWFNRVIFFLSWIKWRQ